MKHTESKARAPFRRRHMLQLTTLALAAFAALPAAHAQAWPTKPITLVVPFPPGGPTDMVARVLAQNVSEQLGQSMIVDNKPGANGNIGNAFVAKAAADGYTVLYNTSSIALSPALYKKLSYNVNTELAPVVLTAVVPLALVVNPDKVKANTVAEYVQFAKAQNGRISYGSAGNGNVTHLAAFQFAQHFGIEATHVPYKGSAPADVDLVAGQIDFLTDTINSVSAFIKDGKLKLLAVSTPKRLPNFPQAPTLAESGMTGYESGAWQGVMVPIKTPKEVVDRLNTAFNKALKDPEVLKKLAIQSTEPLGSTPAEYGAYVKKEIARWDSVVKSTGVSLD